MKRAIKNAMKYLITYDLNRTGQNYEGLYELIKNLGDYRHPMQNTWFVKSNLTAGQIRDALRPALDENDKLFVCSISNWGSINIGTTGSWLNTP